MKYGEIAPLLFDNGWHNIIPLTHDKGTYAKWGSIQHQPMTDATLAYYIKKHGDAQRVGIVHGACHGIVSVDIDILDVEARDDVLRIANDCLPRYPLVRVGREPKLLLMYRGVVKSVKPHPIEIFGTSGQIAAFGMHPTAGKPYTWIENRSPLNTRPNELSEVTQSQIDEFLGRFMRDVRPRASGVTIDWQRDDEAAAERRVGGVDACAAQLRDARCGTRYPTILSITGYLVNEGATPEEAADFVDQWFPDQHRNEEFKNVYAVALKAATTAAAKWNNIDWEMNDE